MTVSTVVAHHPAEAPHFDNQFIVVDNHPVEAPHFDIQFIVVDHHPVEAPHFNIYHCEKRVIDTLKLLIHFIEKYCGATYR